MRPGISIILSPADRRRLEALVEDRNVAQKHVWRARIVLHSADGIGTNGIMRRTGKSKTCVWRWQERFAQEGYDGLLGSIRNFVLWAIVMKKKGASYGNREGTIGPAVGGA